MAVVALGCGRAFVADDIGILANVSLFPSLMMFKFFSEFKYPYVLIFSVLWYLSMLRPSFDLAPASTPVLPKRCLSVVEVFPWLFIEYGDVFCFNFLPPIEMLAAVGLVLLGLNRPGDC